jgi:hypothetical protein
MTFQEYVMAAAEAILNSSLQRAGQAYFNLLNEVRPDLAEYVRGTLYDPFYRDARIPEFLAFIASRWDMPKEVH